MSKVRSQGQKEESHRVAWKHSELTDIPGTTILQLIEMSSCYLHGRSWTLPQMIELELFRKCAQEHGVEGAVTALNNEGLLIKDGSAEDFPGDQYFANLIQHERFLRLLKTVDLLCSTHKIQYSVFKGPTLVDQVYEDGGIRSYGDIDIFVASREELGRLLEDSFFKAENVIIDEQPNSFTHPGRVHVTIESCTIEFFFPIDTICDPMFDFIDKNKYRLFSENRDNGYCTPPKTMHFIFLIVHMLKHLCTRHLWHLDILMFYKKYKSELDMQIVAEELERLQLCQLSHFLTQFYRKQFDIDIGLFPSRQLAGWNTEIVINMSSAKQLHGNIGVNRLKKFPITTGIVAATRFFIISDPEYQFMFKRSTGVTWLASLLGLKMRAPNAFVIWLLTNTMLLLKPFLSSIVRLIILRRYNKDSL